MHTLFQQATPGDRGVTQPARWAVVRERLQDNLADVIRHVRDNSYAVNSRHLLVRILTDLNVDTSLPLMEYHRIVTDRSLEVAKANKITSTLWRGDVLEHGVFYGDDTEETLIAVNEDFDLLNVENDWHTLQPVKVLRHDRSSLALEPLDGRPDPYETGSSVVQIDVVKLAHQYRQFMAMQRRNDVNFLETPQQFVYRYPLTNALLTHVDYAILNRLKVLNAGGKPTEFRSSWPMRLRDLSDKVDDYLLERVSYLHRQSRIYDNQLQQVEPVVADDLLEVVRLPQVPATRQITWALILARIPVIKFLVQLNHDLGSARNRQYETRLRKGLREIRNDRDLEYALPPGRAIEVMDELERDIARYL